MQVIRTRRAGIEVRTLVTGDSPNRKARRSSKVTNRWLRGEIYNPERKALTKAEWCLRGDYIRSIKRNIPDVVGVDELSLNDLADIHESVGRCSSLRAIAILHS